MRVISMVPSWTETLIEAGIEVVGRTRYCIHPETVVDTIAVVGGTKDADWELIKTLRADVLLLDREENPFLMAQNSPVKIVDTHVSSLKTLQEEFLRLGSEFSNKKLKAYSQRLEAVSHETQNWNWENPPGLIKWISPLKITPKNFVYLIWRNPWMAVGPETFISSQLAFFGGEKYLFPQENGKYPTIDLDTLGPENTVLFFSSEPYPFENHLEKIRALPFSSALIDGEKLSWFGIRALKFLEAEVLRGK